LAGIMPCRNDDARANLDFYKGSRLFLDHGIRVVMLVLQVTQLKIR